MALLGQSVKSSVPAKVALVPDGEDRLAEHHIIGVSTTAFKVLTDDAGGGLFVMEHASRKKGGPPRHLHHNENEWFYVLQGEYIAEIGSQRFHLKPGDSVLGLVRSHTPGLLSGMVPANC